jgi:periplasmic protein CpxP/Spy
MLRHHLYGITNQDEPMNTKIWMGGLLLTVATLAATDLLAQTAAPAPTAPTSTAPADQGRVGRSNRRGNINKMGMNGGYAAADPATRAQKMTDRLTKQLGLDDAMSKKVYEALLTRDQQVDAIQKSTDDNQAKAKKLKANADQFRTSMQGILTADQFAKFQQMRQHGGGRGKGANDGTDNGADGNKTN